MQINADRAAVLWQEVCQQLSQADVATPIAIRSWFSPCVPVAVVEDTLLIQAATKTARDNLQERWVSTIDGYLAQMGEALTVSFILENENPFNNIDAGPPTGLRGQFSFDSFIVGNSNSFAHAAALAVARDPAKAYNPLFFYGGTGLGKTHLMHAVGNYIMQNNLGVRVLYVTSEQFTNEIISAIGRGNSGTEAFRAKYRPVDVLIIDDVQLLAGRQTTQEEVFNTFNDLYGRDKQIILSSDRPPREINKLEERLRSRFEMGLQADLQAPDFELRMAILRAKAASEDVQVTDEAVTHMANHAKSNVRELEGAFNRVVAYAKLLDRPVDGDCAKAALRTLSSMRSSRFISPNDIFQAISQVQGISTEVLKSPVRTARVALARQMAMYLMREMTDLSLPRIGAQLGRDHSTVLHGLEKIDRLMNQNLSIRQEIERLREMLVEGAE